MPFIPHSPTDIDAMLKCIGIETMDQLFDEIPAELKHPQPSEPDPGLNELQVNRLMRERAQQDQPQLNFIGAGAYEHHIPAAVWELTTRGEFYSAYTPYQAEASQGTLQTIYEFQSMMAELTGMDASNASLYDGASALAEAVLMAVRANKKYRKVLIPRSLSPFYRQVVNNIVSLQDIDLIELAIQHDSSTIDTARLDEHADGLAALVIPQPNFFGCYEAVDQLTDWAHQQNALTIAVCNPISLAVVTPPGDWGQHGADIAVGEGQPLGAPLCSGGPYFGYICCKKPLLRQMPGRIIGRTIDLEGKPGFTLTLQAREQHIRRAKATSNICSNQGLMVTAATIHMALLGADGLQQVAYSCLHNAHRLAELACHIDGVSRLFERPHFHEVALRLPIPAAQVIAKLATQNIQAGFDLQPYYPQFGHTLLVCATETKTEQDLQRFAQALSQALSA